MELTILVAMITIAASSYLIMYSAKIYEFFKTPLRFFDFKQGSAEKHLGSFVLKNHIVLVGVHRLGHHLVDSLKKQKTPFVIVDFDPEVVEKYAAMGLSVFCGDINDEFVQEQTSLASAKMVISTIPDLQDNLNLLTSIFSLASRHHVKPKLIFTALDEAESKLLYQKGVDYVISPKFMGGMHLAKILGGRDKSFGLQKLRENHLEILLENSRG